MRGFPKTAYLMALTLASVAPHVKAEGIDRKAVVSRHNPVTYVSSEKSPAQVGNGRFAFGAESMVSHYLSFTMGADRSFRDVFNKYMEENRIQVTDSDLTYTSDGLVTFNMIVKMPHSISIYDVDQFLHEHCDLKKLSYSNFA